MPLGMPRASPREPPFGDRRTGHRDARAAGWRIVPARGAALAVLLGEIGQHFVAQTNEAGIVALAWTRQGDIDDPFDAARPRRHRDNAVTEVERLIDVVCDENHRDAFVF